MWSEQRSPNRTKQRRDTHTGTLRRLCESCQKNQCPFPLQWIALQVLLLGIRPNDHAHSERTCLGFAHCTKKTQISLKIFMSVAQMVPDYIETDHWNTLIVTEFPSSSGGGGGAEGDEHLHYTKPIQSALSLLVLR